MPYGKRKSVIDLTTVVPSSEIQNGEVRLDKCSLPDLMPQPGFCAGYYGFQSQNGLAFATYYGDLHGFKPRSVVFSVKLDHPVLAVVRPDNIQDVDFVHFTRLSEKMVVRLADFWREEMEAAGWKQKDLDAINWRYVEKFIPLFEQPVAKLLAEPDFRHVKIFVYPARAQTIKTSHAWFAVGLTRLEFIESAHVRFEDGINVILPER